MLVTCDTSHLPIGPCSLVGRLPSEETPRQSCTARMSSSRESGENTADGGIRSAFVFVRLCDVGIGADNSVVVAENQQSEKIPCVAKQSLYNDRVYIHIYRI